MYISESARRKLKLEGLLRISFVRGMDQVNALTVYRREVHEEKYSTFGVIGCPDSRQSATLEILTGDGDGLTANLLIFCVYVHEPLRYPHINELIGESCSCWERKT